MSDREFEEEIKQIEEEIKYIEVAIKHLHEACGDEGCGCEEPLARIKQRLESQLTTLRVGMRAEQGAQEREP